MKYAIYVVALIAVAFGMYENYAKKKVIREKDTAVQQASEADAEREKLEKKVAKLEAELEKEREKIDALAGAEIPSSSDSGSSPPANDSGTGSNESPQVSARELREKRRAEIEEVYQKNVAQFEQSFAETDARLDYLRKEEKKTAALLDQLKALKPPFEEEKERTQRSRGDDDPDENRGIRISDADKQKWYAKRNAKATELGRDLATHQRDIEQVEKDRKNLEEQKRKMETAYRKAKAEL